MAQNDSLFLSFLLPPFLSFLCFLNFLLVLCGFNIMYPDPTNLFYPSYALSILATSHNNKEKNLIVEVVVCHNVSHCIPSGSWSRHLAAHLVPDYLRSALPSPALWHQGRVILDMVCPPYPQAFEGSDLWSSQTRLLTSPMMPCPTHANVSCLGFTLNCLRPAVQVGFF